MLVVANIPIAVTPVIVKYSVYLFNYLCMHLVILYRRCQAATMVTKLHKTFFIGVSNRFWLSLGRLKNILPTNSSFLSRSSSLFLRLLSSLRLIPTTSFFPHCHPCLSFFLLFYTFSSVYVLGCHIRLLLSPSLLSHYLLLTSLSYSPLSFHLPSFPLLPVPFPSLCPTVVYVPFSFLVNYPPKPG